MNQIPFVDLKAQYLSIKEDIDNVLQKIINETAFIGGKYVQIFENEFAKLYGVKHCISCANGTDAIYITLKMLGIGKGDEVITTAASWISTSETISQTGALPVFVDVDEYSTINVELIEKKINSKTKAIIPVHLYGQSANIVEIRKIAEENSLFIIEDCAQAHLSEYNNQLLGTFGIASTFSFYPGKNLGAYGDAGCILTNNNSLAQKLRMYANHGTLKKHEHIVEGINSRLDGLQAGILSVKLPHLRKWTEQRINNAKYYDKNLKNVGDLVIPPVRIDSKHTYHLYVIKSSSRNKLKEYLSDNGVRTAIHYPKALPLLEAYKYLNCNITDYPVVSKYQDEILSLPMFPELTTVQMDFVISKIKDFFNQ